MSKLFFVIASSVLAFSSSTSSAEDLPLPMKAVSIQVTPQVAIRSPGQMLSLDVRCGGVSGVGTQTPVSVVGAPEGTNIKVTPVTNEYALVSLVFPNNIAQGRYTLTITVGGSELSLAEEVEVRIEE